MLYLMVTSFAASGNQIVSSGENERELIDNFCKYRTINEIATWIELDKLVVLEVSNKKIQIKTETNVVLEG